MSLFFVDLTDFLHSHRPHGSLTADATTPAWNGYPLTVVFVGRKRRGFTGSTVPRRETGRRVWPR
jgi:hypothetical protein